MKPLCSEQFWAIYPILLINEFVASCTCPGPVLIIVSGRQFITKTTDNNILISLNRVGPFYRRGIWQNYTEPQISICVLEFTAAPCYVVPSEHEGSSSMCGRMTSHWPTWWIRRTARQGAYIGQDNQFIVDELGHRRPVCVVLISRRQLIRTDRTESNLCKS